MYEERLESGWEAFALCGGEAGSSARWLHVFAMELPKTENPNNLYPFKITTSPLPLHPPPGSVRLTQH